MKWVSKGKKKKYSVKRFFKGFGYAFCGIISAVKKEQNLLIELIVASITIILGFLLNISTIEFCIVVITIGIVISLELVNSAIEYTVDMAMPEMHPLAKIAKDVAAGSVLFFSICAFIIGLIIYLPKIISILS